MRICRLDDRKRLIALFAMLALVLVRSALAADGKPPEPPPEVDPALAEAIAKDYPTTLADLRAIEQQVRKVVTKVTPCTVGVQVGSSQGSGVIISEDGFVLTAGHVIGKPGVPAVFILHDGRRVKGKTLGINNGIDSGLMKITDKGKWPHVEMADPLASKAGDWCVSTGHPGGYVRGRAPVVRLGRVLFTNKKVICTDCTLVGGDSGGPLFNLDGQVIGIHSRIGWQLTTNFHVPIKTYRDTWDRLAASEIWGGRLEDSVSTEARPLVGIAGDPNRKPCRINEVFPDSPAAEAGLKVGDVIAKFDGQAVENFLGLTKLLSKKKPGQGIPLEILRGEETLELRLTLGARFEALPGGDPDEEE